MKYTFKKIIIKLKILQHINLYYIKIMTNKQEVKYK